MKRGYFKTYLKILIIILILCAIIWGAINFLNIQYGNEKIETIKTNMLLIKAKTQIVAEKVNIKEKDAKYVGTDLKEMQEDENIKKLVEKQVINLESKESLYYALDKENLNELGLETIKLENGYYIVDYKTNEIFFTEGIEDKEGNTKYSLSELEN